MGDFVKLGAAAEIPAGKIKKYVTNGQEIAVYNANGNFFATTTICPHAGGPLDEGELDGNTVTCPWHGWMFDVGTGVSPLSPNVKVKTFEVKVENGDILVKI